MAMIERSVVIWNFVETGVSLYVSATEETLMLLALAGKKEPHISWTISYQIGHCASPLLQIFTFYVLMGGAMGASFCRHTVIQNSYCF